MATSKKNIFLDGIWIKRWKFRSDKKPFIGNTTSAQIKKIKHKIENFAEKKIRDREAWKRIGEKFHSLHHSVSWEASRSGKVIFFILTITLMDLTQPPDKIIVAPPPPKQPPPFV